MQDSAFFYILNQSCYITIVFLYLNFLKKAELDSVIVLVLPAIHLSIHFFFHFSSIIMSQWDKTCDL